MHAPIWLGIVTETPRQTKRDREELARRALAVDPLLKVCQEDM